LTRSRPEGEQTLRPGAEGAGGGAGSAAGEIAAGRVGRPHGLDGSFYVTRALARVLTLGAEVSIGGRPARIVRRAGTEQRPIVRLEGVSERTAAEALRGVELTVARDAAPRLAEGEWWAHELEGCAVLAGEQLIGTVTRLIELPSCEALEVEPRGGGNPLLVPMVKDAVRRVEVEQREIEIDAGFLGLGEGDGERDPSGREEDG
jgi:16S rRNA processing protein RimM